ncbi:MAG: exo-alpha-sialidase [Planctomycetota bacterium]|nr:MAG: exo-alpha-sialidase [Planctomycetota bacterium]REK20314.1 MAG: exo-alpha-sialidase [Planctomycetota bacterium]REK26811.1 MAG: exo-alpha-sialidase [Planctomycetota bacterium]
MTVSASRFDGLWRSSFPMMIATAQLACGLCRADEPPWKLNQPIVGVEKEVYRKSPGPKAAALGWTYYVGPRLERMERRGVERIDDVHDEQQARWSEDNGRTWSDWVDTQPSSNVVYAGVVVWEGGVCRVHDPGAERLVELWLRQINHRGLYHNFTYWRTSEDFGRTWSEPQQLCYEEGDQFNPKDPLAEGFLQKNHAHPGSSILIRRDGAIVACVNHANAEGDPQNNQRPWRMGALSFVGEWDEQAGDYRWEAGRRLEISPDKSSRGLMEAEPAELGDGRVLVVWRGSNTPTTPGRKWYAVSGDGGLTFSEPAEWKYDDGSSFYSPSSYHRMIRHSETERLYWFGNICEDPPSGNSPRYPLVIAEVDETVPALKRNTVTVIDDRRDDQPAALQFSNFSLVEDRETHQFELQLTTYGQDPGSVYTADNWKYRLTLAENKPQP